MLDVISQAKNAIEAYNTKLKAISANITNVLVPGYKRTDVSFQNVFVKLIKPGTPGIAGSNEGGINPFQTGGTAAISTTSIDFSQGDIQGAGRLDLSIKGNGLFIVSADDGKTYLYTRNGEFQIVNNKLLTKSGLQVYGFDKSGKNPANQLVPIDLSGTAYDPTQISFDSNGALRASATLNADGKSYTYGAALPFQIALSSFKNPSGLQNRDGTTFSETGASGAPSTPTTSGGENVGFLIPQSREQANIFYTSEIVDSLEIQRALSSCLTAIRLLNDSISQFISKMG